MASSVHSVQIDELLRDLKKLNVVDNVPVISSESVGIRYDISGALDPSAMLGAAGYLRGLEDVDTNFHLIYSVVAKAKALLAQGDQFVNTMYTMRSCSRALGKIDLQDKSGETNVPLQVFNILRPEMSKLSAMNEFQERLTTFISTEVMGTMLALKEQKLAVLDHQYEAFELLLDLTIRLDSVKDMKASILNDFAFYKRAFYAAKDSLTETCNVDEIAAEIQTLQVFIADPRCPKSKLLSTLSAKLFKKQEGRSPEMTLSLVIDVFHWCIKQLETSSHVLPDEKWRLLRTLPYVLLLVSDEKLNCVVGNPEILNVFKNKRVVTSSFNKLYRQTPIVPLLCDMHVNLYYTLSQCSHFDQTAGVCQSFVVDVEDPRIRNKYALKTHWLTMRDKHEAFLSKFSPFITKMEAICGGDYTKLGSSSSEIASQAIRLCEEGLTIVSQWKEAIIEECAYKYAVPSKESTSENEYERVVKDNYSASELRILIEMSARLKSLTSTMIRAEEVLAPLLRIGIHSRVQTFVQNQMMEVLHRTEKKKRKGKVKTIEQLLHIRRLAADWLTDAEPSALQDYITKPKHRASRLTFRQRAVALSIPQLHVMRMFIDSVCENSKKRAMFSGADIDKTDIEVLRSFYEESAVYPYLLDLSSVLRGLSDLSVLYYREFYMEMARKVQFPIAMSLPWIMIKQVVENPTSKARSCILYALDVYNDAAQFALCSLKRKHVYDEIEAEAKLVFEQFVFLLAEHIYAHYKALAASTLLDADFKKCMHEHKQSNFLDVNPIRYGVLMRQCHVEILGRTVDLAVATSEQINTKLEVDIKAAISRFEGQGITGILELQSQLDVLRECHDSIAEIVTINDFDAVLMKCDCQQNRGRRVETKVLSDLTRKVFTRMSFDHTAGRFLSKVNRGPNSHEGRSSVPSVYGAQHSRAYELVNKPMRGFLSSEHVCAIIEFVECSSIVSATTSYVDATLKDEVKSVVASIQNEVASKDMLQGTTESDVSTVFMRYQSQLKPLLDFSDIQTVFNHFERVGNALSFLYMLQSAAELKQLQSSMNVLPLLASSLSKYAEYFTAPGPHETKQSPMYSALQNVPHTELGTSLATSEVERHVEHEKFCRTVLQQGVSAMKSSVVEMESSIGVRQLADTWFVLKCLLCMSDEVTQEVVGDGLFWAGAMFETLSLDSRSQCDYVKDVLELRKYTRAKGDAKKMISVELIEFLRFAEWTDCLDRQIKAITAPIMQPQDC